MKAPLAAAAVNTGELGFGEGLLALLRPALERLEPGGVLAVLSTNSGAAQDLSSSDTPWSYRDANWGAVFAGVDGDPANVGAIGDWSRGYQEALHPHSAGGAYVNMMMDEGQERVRASYRDNYDRLAQIKGQYDPDNRFRVNQNIEPAAPGS